MALVAFGGPVIGGLGALAVAGAGMATGSQLLLAVADMGFFLNMMNLMPISVLDGGNIAGAISKHFLLAGLVAGCTAVAVMPVGNPMMCAAYGGGAVVVRWWCGLLQAAAAAAVCVRFACA